MTPEEQTKVSPHLRERVLRAQIAAAKQHLMALTDELEAHVAKREEKISGTADFIRALRQDAS